MNDANIQDQAMRYTTTITLEVDTLAKTPLEQSLKQELLDYTMKKELANLPQETKGLIKQSLLALYATKVFSRPNSRLTHYYDGRRLSQADQLNIPDKLALSPWQTLSLEEVIRSYFIVHTAHKVGSAYPFPHMVTAPITAPNPVPCINDGFSIQC